jgi:quinol monooxygenase YgiN
MSKSRSVHYTIQFDVTDGNMGEFESLADKAIATVEADEPDCVAYRWDLNGSSVRLFERFTDEAAMMAHLGGSVATDIFPKLMAIAPVSRFDIHGDVSDEARAALEAFGGTIYTCWKGFDR